MRCARVSELSPQERGRAITLGNTSPRLGFGSRFNRRPALASAAATHIHFKHGQQDPQSSRAPKKRILTGDTPTGKLHLGHYVGSVENRLALQDEYDCYFLIANKHAFTTRADKPADIRQSVIDIATDYLAAGIDPNRSTIFIQSEVPAIDELTFFFSMLIPFNRVMRNPTLAQEIKDKELGDHYPFGFPLYAVGQCADILAFRPELVPVGEDQLPHLELSREVARRFDQLYCGVDPHTEDKDYVARGGVFPVIQPKLGRVKRLVGLARRAPMATCSR